MALCKQIKRFQKAETGTCTSLATAKIGYNFFARSFFPSLDTIGRWEAEWRGKIVFSHRSSHLALKGDFNCVIDQRGSKPVVIRKASTIELTARLFIEFFRTRTPSLARLLEI